MPVKKILFALRIKCTKTIYDTLHIRLSVDKKWLRFSMIKKVNIINTANGTISYTHFVGFQNQDNPNFDLP